MSGEPPMNAVQEPCQEKPARDSLFPLAYEELRGIAARYLRSERAGQTLQPTALVHEAYVRLLGTSQPQVVDSAQLLAAAARAMRHILVERARHRRAEKRGGCRERVVLDSGLAASRSDGLPVDQTEFIDAIDQALHRLAAFDSRLSQVVELRFFGGLTIEETARVLRTSTRKVNREWLMAKGWLHREMLKGV